VRRKALRKGLPRAGLIFVPAVFGRSERIIEDEERKGKRDLGGRQRRD